MDAVDDNGSETPSDDITDNISDPTPSISTSASAFVLVNKASHTVFL